MCQNVQASLTRRKQRLSSHIQKRSKVKTSQSQTKQEPTYISVAHEVIRIDICSFPGSTDSLRNTPSPPPPQMIESTIIAPCKAHDLQKGHP